MPSVGTLSLDLIAITAKFEKGLQNAGKEVKGFADRTISAITGLGSRLTGLLGVAAAGFGIYQLAGAFADASKQVDELGKAAGRLGVATPELAALKFAAAQSGIEFEALSKFAATASKRVAEFVTTGGGPAAKALEKFNLALTDSAGNILPITKLLPKLAEEINRAGSAGEQINLADSIFGKGAGEGFITLLKDSGNFMESLALKTEQARRLGILFTDDQAKRLEGMNDAIERIGFAWLGVRVRLLDKVAPAISELADRIAELTVAAGVAASNLVDNLVAAFSGNDEAQQKIVYWFSSLGALVQGSATALLTEAFVALELATIPLLEHWFDSIVSWLSRDNFIANKIAIAYNKIGRSVLENLTNIFGPKMAQAMGLTGEHGLKELDDRIDKLKYELDAIDAGKGIDAGTIVTSLSDSLAGSGYSAAAAWDRLITQLSPLASGFSAASDDVLGFSDALKKASLSGIDLKKLLEELKGKGGDDISMFATRWRATYEALGEGIKGFSRNASEAFADFALDGKNSIDELIRSFERMAITITAQKAIFGPLFDAFGGWVGNGFSSNTGTSDPNFIGPKAEGQLDLSGLQVGGGASSAVVVNVMDYSGGVEVQQRQSGGTTILDILVPGMKAAFAQGKMNKTMKDVFNLSPAPRY